MHTTRTRMHTHTHAGTLTDSHMRSQTRTRAHTYIHTYIHTHTHHSLDGKKKKENTHNYIDLLNIYTYNYTIHTFQTLYNTNIIQA